MITQPLTDAVNPRRIGELSLFIDDVRNDSGRAGWTTHSVLDGDRSSLDYGHRQDNIDDDTSLVDRSSVPSAQASARPEDKHGKVMRDLPRLPSTHTCFCSC